MSVPFHPVRFGALTMARVDRPDGSTLLRSNVPLDPHPARATERLLHWAAHAPDRVFIARRSDTVADKLGAWQALTYAQTLLAVGVIAQALLDRGLDARCPVVIISENSIEHALLALAALHAGIRTRPSRRRIRSSQPTLASCGTHCVS